MSICPRARDNLLLILSQCPPLQLASLGPDNLSIQFPSQGNHQSMSVLDTYSECVPCYVVGIMSGTSLDGIDMCLCEIKGSSSRVLQTGDTSSFALRVIHFSTVPFPVEGIYAHVKPSLKQVMTIEHSSVDMLCRVNFDFSRLVASSLLDFLREVDSRELLSFSAFEERKHRIVLGSHGQTIWHANGSTLQIGDTEVLAHASGMMCVGNFRAADVAVGGQGAPLVPFFDSVVARLSNRTAVCFQNLGGIGNVTFVSQNTCIAFDTGPANVATNELLDLIAAQPPHSPLAPLTAFVGEALGLSAGSSLYDRNGVFSTGGVVSKDMLNSWLSDPDIMAFRNCSPPKSTGRELFGYQFVTAKVLPLINVRSDGMIQSFRNVCRTLIYFAAYLLAESYERFLPKEVDTVVLSGGGRRHPLLLDDITKLLNSGSKEVRILSLGDLIEVPSDIDADDAKEAIAFAVFAHERVLSLVHRDRTYFTNITSATGASQSICLGQFSIP